ncbi:MAG: hypothetical protein ACJAYJ_001980, partial [Saprospiraceae bacterium]
DSFGWPLSKRLQRYDGYKIKSYDLGKEKNTISRLYKIGQDEEGWL